MIMQKIGSVVVLGIVCLAWSAQGALVVPVSQSLHCMAGAQITDLNLSAEDRPADVIGGSSYGMLSHRAAAKVEGVYQGTPTPVPSEANAFSTANLTINGDGFAISTSGYHSYAGPLGESGSIQSEVLLSFDLTRVAEFDLVIAANPHAIGQATIRSGGQIVKVMGLAGAFKADEISFPEGCDFDEATRIASYGQQITLDAGRYDVEFSLGLMPHAGNLGTGTADFSMMAVPASGAVPEPATVGMMVMAGVGLLGMRRR